MSENLKPELTGLLRWRNGQSWCVGHRKIFVIAQAPTLQEAVDRWCMSFAHAVLLLEGDGKTLADMPKTPDDMREKWVKRHEAEGWQP